MLDKNNCQVLILDYVLQQFLLTKTSMRQQTQQAKSIKSERERRSSYYDPTLENKMFKIICKGSHMALRTQLRQKKLPEDQLRVIGGIEDPKSIKQLWLIKRIKDNKKQIINFATDLVMECDDDGGIKLQKGRQKGSQKFQIEEIRENKYRDSFQGLPQVRIKDNNSFYLVLDGLLEVAKFDETDQNQIFYIKDVNYLAYKEFQETCIIINPETRKCLDVTRGDQAIGTSVCLYEINNRANQRWIVQPPIENQSQEDIKYSIINMLTGLRLWYDKKAGLIQSDNTEKIWQIHKKHGKSGELFETTHRKYINRQQQGSLAMQNYSNGTKWQFL